MGRLIDLEPRRSDVQPATKPAPTEATGEVVIFPGLDFGLITKALAQLRRQREAKDDPQR